MVTIRGNNVFPSSIEAILREFTEVTEYRIIVERVRAKESGGKEERQHDDRIFHGKLRASVDWKIMQEGPRGKKRRGV